MNRLTSLSAWTKLNVAGLILAAIGMLLQIVAGSDLYPTLTGPIVLLIGAAVVTLRPGGGMRYVGLGLPLVLGVGLLVSAVMSTGFLDQLTRGEVGLVIGSASHVAGLFAAVVGGTGMLLRPDRSPALEA
jgi:hypothetical protein